MHPKDRPEAHQIVWDEPSLEHSTWQGPPAFDFSQAYEDGDKDAPELVSAAPPPGSTPDDGDHLSVITPAPAPPALPTFTSDAEGAAAPSTSASDNNKVVAASEVDPPEYVYGIDDESADVSPRKDAAPKPHEEELPEDSLTIGRSRSNGIVLDDMLVSRRHVVITADDEGLLLRDLDSRNGTFVNGRKVEQTHLHEGDRIGIGAATFEVRDGWLVAV